MLRGEKVGLRARHEEDGPVLRAEFYDDPVHCARTESAPWRPVPPTAPDRRVMAEGGDQNSVQFSVVELAGGTLIGAATVWGIDTHHRQAHLGLGVFPAARGQGYSTDIVAVLLDYAFTVRNLHRIQLETLADNTAMLRAAERNGFRREGVLHRATWVLGEYMDEVLLALLAEEWRAAR
ncbi:N-acetyltransferase [Kitasatospora sp. MMS16-BH015]|uniref:GNAT family N-acetyltransferase n=1 Tax=Kitasatospora sp. MMS16-BH015 TaxID=2018025 RepID=UPI000CA32172|nr:GNAT family protein [Kitasatospora sp. MMS16-BH015]AUG77523.1 N-acetyltransferase [Kitasatospora sp. MMS16-BH015]